MKVVDYILQFYDAHHTLDGGTRTEHYDSFDKAKAKWEGMLRATCTQHGPARNCLRNMTITKQTSIIERLILERQ